MIGLAGWLEIIKAVLQFPDAILRLVRAFQSTAEEDREKLIARIQAEAAGAKAGERPRWD
jgi:hypothetical protein